MPNFLWRTIYFIPKLTLLSAGLLGFFAMFLTWMNFGLHFPFSVVVADFCYDVDEYTIDRRLQDRINMDGTYGGLNDLLQCADFWNANDTYQYTQELQVELLLKINTTQDATEKSTYETQYETLSSVQPVILDVRNCVWVKSVFDPYKNSVCGSELYVLSSVITHSYRTGLVMVWATNFVLCVVLIPHVVFSLRAYTVFIATKGAVRFRIMIDR
jgi:hypothetical protein